MIRMMKMMIMMEMGMMMVMGMIETTIPLPWPTPTQNLAPSIEGRSRRRKESEKWKSQGDIFNGFDDNGHQCSGEDGMPTWSHIFLGSQSGPPCSTQSSKLKAWTWALVEWNRTWVNAGMSNKKADPFTNLVVSPSLARTLLVRTSSPYLQPIEISFGGAKRVKATFGISLARLLVDIFCG